MERSELDRLAAGKYVSLTTFKRDGTAVATPVWLVRDGDRLRVITDASSGKAKRIRNNAEVMVASCTMRGRVTGEPLAARATLEDAEATLVTAGLIKKRYGLLGRILASRGSPEDRVGITIELN